MAGPWHLSWGATALRLGLSAVFGAVVGFEREWSGHEAGVRTHLLMALGSALFAVMSVGAFSAFIVPRNSTDLSIDVTRIPSYIAAGVGFIGGGAILKSSDRVHGLTTAASLWAVAAIGLATGLGFWQGAVLATTMALVALLADRPVSQLVRKLRGKTDS